MGGASGSRGDRAVMALMGYKGRGLEQRGRDI